MSLVFLSIQWESWAPKLVGYQILQNTIFNFHLKTTWQYPIATSHNIMVSTCARQSTTFSCKTLQILWYIFLQACSLGVLNVECAALYSVTTVKCCCTWKPLNLLLNSASSWLYSPSLDFIEPGSALCLSGIHIWMVWQIMLHLFYPDYYWSCIEQCEWWSFVDCSTALSLSLSHTYTHT